MVPARKLDQSVHLASYEKKMKKLERLIGAMLDSVINTVIVCGPSGIGKTYTINKILQDRSENEAAPTRYKNITGKITARAFWDHLAENSTYDCVTFFDDADFIFHDPACIGLLREASEKYTQRIINYRTARSKGDSCVTFDGKIIVSTNLRIGSSPHLNAVKVNIEVTFLERLAVAGLVNPRKSGGAKKVGTFFANDSAAPCRRSLGGKQWRRGIACQCRKPPEAVAEGQP